ncbi:unnamed protein product [Leptidea sinapis]|uniref:Dynein intermediate chain 3, ciliary n=1 Tax=Leptidea sinapis TaxID=189913 RepID=A0A5E4QUF3_9NEOP|nr:unnamed protein product [Leptidea sinapis]
MMDKDLTYAYFKPRKDFGKQPLFCEVDSHLIDSISPSKHDQQQYCLRNPVNHDTQTSYHFSEKYMNTKELIVEHAGINHTEGGWPKDIHVDDEEATSRYCRRVERDDAYIHTVLSTYPQFKSYIDQNNGIEMYDMFFKNMPTQKSVEKSMIQVGNAFKDDQERPISSISWTFEDNSKMVVAYCNKQYPLSQPVNKDFTCSIWDIENPNSPMLQLHPTSACWQLVCSPGNSNVIVGGLEDGTVCIFDTRVNSQCTSSSPLHLAHRDPISSLIYIPSRLNTDFFSASTDGMCKWWDVRNTSSPTDTLIISIQIPPGESKSIANSEGISSLQYDRSFPTKFLCGTDTGFVINVNRKGKTHNEIMSAVFAAHYGPVHAVHRSPCTSKIFITCGDWRVNIWSDDIHSGPIITGMKHVKKITDVVWSPHRISNYMSISADGKFRVWDLLRKYHEPVITLPVSKYPLLKLKPHEDGQKVAVGDKKGIVYLLYLSENLVISSETDKPLMLKNFDRETRREHILESRVREIKLRLKLEDEKPVDMGIIDNEEAILKVTEDEYRSKVSQEMLNIGSSAAVSGSKGRKNIQMRER